MAELLQDLQWSDPLFPAVSDPQWEKKVQSELGLLPEMFTMLAPNEWLRYTVLMWPRYIPKEFSMRLADICMLVCAQENGCRYCYGLSKAYMRIHGYSNRMIRAIEREMQLAELNEKDRAFMHFCRSLSRSNPRPPKADRDRLIELGFSQRAVAEMAFYICNNCFINRVMTFISAPPMESLERMSVSFFGWFMKPMMSRKLRRWGWTGNGTVPAENKSFSRLVNTLEGLPAAAAVNDLVASAFASNVLSKDLKILMIAVVAKSLECSFCEQESREMAINLGFSNREFDDATSTLVSSKLTTEEEKLLSWTRMTVNYQNGPIQDAVRELTGEFDDRVVLEAIGVAALANAMVRLAVLLDE